ncbi:amidohydrolase family protein [Streptomyces sp. SID10853]|uniref:dihydroorotase n=1 Tax=Streptomyces sp. SID10853 TaxID=2706028 RepID=UPI0013BEF6BF|nr:amidohydrolase family protein [Streptomyces sp. SID10853]NDZ78686.1 amidohydrolase family protein [Streptomyces sp. SID10853]
MDMNSEKEPCDLSVVGHVVCRAGNYPRGEVRIRDGRIVEVLPEAGDAPHRERIDAGSSYVLPGVIDPHVHALSDPREGVEAATRAAAAGGVTTILEMPFDQSGPIWTAARVEAKKQMVAEQAHVDVGLFATVRPGGGVAEVAAMAEAGAVTFKVSTYHTHADRFPRTPDDEMVEVFRAIAATGRRVCVHAENDEIVRKLVEELYATGTEDPRAHCAARPPVTETAAVANTLELARTAGAKVHFVHMSLPHSIDLVQAYARQGVDATAEVCPQYLMFTEDDMASMGTRIKVNPPVRTRQDTDGMWSRLAADAIDTLSSDHAPWPIVEKDKPNIFDNASGAPGVETLFPVTAAIGLHERGVSIESLVRVSSWRPAELFGIGHRKGDLRAGLDGDVVVFDPEAEWEVDETVMQSNAGWSPFHGLKLRGRVTRTISRGETVHQDGKLSSRPGRGRLVEFGEAERA